MWGSSAGGHLVALLGTSGDVGAFDVGAHLDQSSRVQAVCDYYGPTDFTVFVTTPGYESHARAESPEAKLIGGAVLDNRDKAARVNPITYVSDDDPAFLIVHGDQDKTVPLNQSELLFEALKQVGVSAHLHTIRGAGHGQGFGGPEIERMVGDFFERHLKAVSPPSNLGGAMATESAASPLGGRAGQPYADQGITWPFVRARAGITDDGRVTRDMYKGSSTEFHQLDRNGDGVLTKADFEVRPP